MLNVMKRLAAAGLALALSLGTAFPLMAGGSGFNVVVIVNSSSSNSVQLGNYLMERRQIPPQNLLSTSWTGGNVEWQWSDFSNVIYAPLQSMLASRQLTNQIDYVVLSMDFPYRVTSPTSTTPNGTTSTLFYGFKPDNPTECSIAAGSSNSYAGSECIFRQTPPISGITNFYMAMMITASNLLQAEGIVDQGVAGDSTFPGQSVALAKNLEDPVRNVRFTEYDNTVFDARLDGDDSLAETNADQPYFLGTLFGYTGGNAHSGTKPDTFIPGALADNLTSFGGQIFEDAGQTSELDFLTNGAADSYGTVTEPCNYLEKFPDSQAFFYQLRGFSAAECYYMSLTNPYEGLTMGEPLSAPFAHPASGFWSGLSSNAPISGVTNLSVSFTAPDAQHPVQQVDLFVDGNWFETVTNIEPATGNTISVTLNGNVATYTVPANATIQSIASNVVNTLNSSPYSNTTMVVAWDHGDRIELQSLDPTKSGSQLALAAASGGTSPVTTQIRASQATFFDTVADGFNLYQIAETNINPPVGAWLELSVTKTNGAVLAVAVTNTVNGTTTYNFMLQFVNLINSTGGLEGSDGLTAADLADYGDYPGYGDIEEFDLRPNSAGYAASQIQVTLLGSADFLNSVEGGATLTVNLADLVARDQLYITAGVTNLPMTVPLNTAALADGYHELEAVAYEGSHVHTQARATQDVIIQNSALSATFTTLVGGTNAAEEGTLQFQVAANTPGIASIQLFSTGGSLNVVSNQQTTVFSVPGSNLGIGLHPFYAIVTATGGRQYRTQTVWIRLIGPEPPFDLSLGTAPTTLSWTATAGRSYDVLSTTNLAVAFQVRATIIPSGNSAQWVETNGSAMQQFYRVRVTP
jgi:uncharacterized protein (TIGR03790 family)